MAKKKILLFIVEGPTDETSLSTVLSRIFSSDEIKFHVVHGEQTELKKPFMPRLSLFVIDHGGYII